MRIAPAARRRGGAKHCQLDVVKHDRQRQQAIIGRDWYPYGIEANRPSIEALLQYVHEHGLTDRRVKLEELFAPNISPEISSMKAR